MDVQLRHHISQSAKIDLVRPGHPLQFRRQAIDLLQQRLLVRQPTTGEVVANFQRNDLTSFGGFAEITVYGWGKGRVEVEVSYQERRHGSSHFDHPGKALETGLELLRWSWRRRR